MIVYENLKGSENMVSSKYQYIVDFLDTHFIDTEYYLNDEAKEMIESGEISIKYIDKLSAEKMIEYLDVERLEIEENIFEI